MSEHEDNQRTPGAHSGTSGIELAPGVMMPASSLRWKYVSASGPGGQHVNRRATKAVLRLWVDELPVSAGTRRRIVELGKGWVVQVDAQDNPSHARYELVIAADEFRSQSRNRQACLDRLRALLVRASAAPKRRIATTPGRGARERRLRDKRIQSEKKQRRQNKPDHDN